MVHPQGSAQQVLSNISTAQQTELLSSRAERSVRSDRLPALWKFGQCLRIRGAFSNSSAPAKFWFSFTDPILLME
jgi:hypothetical protein